jgi:ERF superfamily
MNDDKKTIYQKLLHIQKIIVGLEKDKSTFNYKYVTGDKILKLIKPLMNDLGLILKQEVLSIENERQDYVTKNGSKSEILSKVMMRFTWIDTETGEKDVNNFGANGQNDWEKGLGSAVTYAERYFLLKYFHISTDADDVDNEERKKIAPPPITPTLTDTQLSGIVKKGIDRMQVVLQAINEGKLNASPEQKESLQQEIAKQSINTLNNTEHE